MATQTQERLPELAGISGESRDGQPLAYHRAPADDLAPWIARMFVTRVWQPPENTIHCGLLSDTPFVRLMLGGDWVGEAANARIERSRGALLFGPHSQRMPISVTGPFATIGFALRPGALAALGHPWGRIATDFVTDIDGSGAWRTWSEGHEFAAVSHEAALLRLEEDLRALVARRGAPPPDPLAAALDEAAFADPGEPIGTFAARHETTTRRVARMAARDFGLNPKAVMRRARVLDMASQLLGFADSAEAEEHSLRFYDQSHQIRDFRALMGMTPRELDARPRPILTLGLETRQARRLEVLGRLGQGESGPWR